MNTHESYVSLEVAKLLKEAGFNWKCKGVYNEGKLHIWYEPKSNDWWKCQSDTYAAPTLDVAQRWLREVKGYSIYPTYGGYKIYVLDINDSAGFSGTYGLNSNLTYEEAQEAGIKKALEIILEKGE